MATIEKRGDSWRAIIRRRGDRKSATFSTKAQATAWAAVTEKKLEVVQASQRSLRADFSLPASITAGNILAGAVPNPALLGVYLLLTDGVVTYVGKSKNMLARIAGHSEKGRPFTHYFVHPCHEDELDKLEAKVIGFFDPSGNKTTTHKNPHYV